MTPESKLTSLGITLPDPPKPVAAYVPWTRTGNLIFTAGQIPFLNGQLLFKGSIPNEVSLEDGIVCARQCALNALSIIRGAVGSLDKVKRIVRLGVFVASGPDFYEHPKIANGASELMLELFGDAGRHARTSVGAPALPLGAPVEVEVIAEVA